MKNYYNKELLARLIGNFISEGLDITPLMGKPLSYFDFDKLEKALELKEQDEEKYSLLNQFRKDGKQIKKLTKRQ